MKLKNLSKQLESVLTGSERDCLKFVFGQERVLDSGTKVPNSDKPIFFKRLQLIWDTFKDYDPENIILIDDSPYKTSLNPFYSSLYPTPYTGGGDDSFLKNILYPFLLEIGGSSQTLHREILQKYPSWSQVTLEGDWRENQGIWSNDMYIRDHGDAIHKSKFSDWVLHKTSQN